MKTTSSFEPDTATETPLSFSLKWDAFGRPSSIQTYEQCGISTRLARSLHEVVRNVTRPHLTYPLLKPADYVEQTEAWLVLRPDARAAEILFDEPRPGEIEFGFGIPATLRSLEFQSLFVTPEILLSIGRLESDLAGRHHHAFELRLTFNRVFVRFHREVAGVRFLETLDTHALLNIIDPGSTALSSYPVLVGFDGNELPVREARLAAIREILERMKRSPLSVNAAATSRLVSLRVLTHWQADSHAVRSAAAKRMSF